jgi:anti-sigma factor RsiW
VDCYRTRRRLGAYLDAALDAAAASATAAHLTSCGRCQREVGELERLRAVLRASLKPAEPDWTGFWQGVVRGIADRRQAPEEMVRRRRQGWVHLRWPLGGALAAVLLFSLGIWSWMSGPRPSEASVLVTSARTDDPRGTVMAYSTPEQDVVVVWVFGLE